MKEAQNCWDYKKCDLGPESDKINNTGICSVTWTTYLDGTHSGILDGRACWVTPGIYCGGETQDSFAQKNSTCMNCEFYQKVREEEGSKFMITLLLMKRFKAA